MSRPCSVCRHPQRADIAHTLVAGASYRTVADSFGLSKSALLRHRPHVGAGIVKTAAAIVKDVARHDAEVREYDEASTLIEQVQDLQRRSLRLLDDAEQDRDGRLRAFAISQVRENIKLLFELMPAASAPEKIDVIFSFPSSGASRDAEFFGQREAATASEAAGPASAMSDDAEAAPGSLTQGAGK